MNISRRDALLGAGGALSGAAVLFAEKGAAASPAQDPLVHLWQKRSELLSEADRLADEAAAILDSLPEWARNFDGITIQLPGCKPRTCRTAEEIDAAMSRRSLFSLDPPSDKAVSAWRAEGKAQRDAWVAELERTRRQIKEAQHRSGVTVKDAEHEAIWEDIDRIEDQIVDTQAVTVEGVLVQALFFAELQEDEEQQFYDARLAKSMGIAARRMAPGLAQAERPAGGMQS